MGIESLTYLWIHTANRLSSVTFSLTSLASTLGACPKMVVYPLYRPRKRGGPGQGGARMVIVNLGTASHQLMDREAAARMSGLHQMYLIS